MTLLAICWLPGLTGLLALVFLLRNIPLRYKPLFLISASLPAGFGIISLVLFFFYLLIPMAVSRLSWIFLAGMNLTLIWKMIPQIKKSALGFYAYLSDFKKPKWSLSIGLTLASATLFIATLLPAIQHFLLSIATNIHGGWDARYFWNLKAAFLFRSPEAWQGMFSPKLFWAHPDYPLLWPASLAWGWQALGHESSLVGPWISLVFYLSCAFLLIWYLAARISLAAGWMAGAFFLTIPHYLFWATALYADIPVTFFMTASGFLLILSLEQNHKPLYVLSGLMAGLAAWTKNEGLLFLPWIYLVFFIFLLKNNSRNFRATFRSILALTLGLSLPLFATLFLKMFLGSTGDYLGSQRTLQDYVALLTVPGKTWIIFTAFLAYMASFQAWRGLWWFFIMGVCVAVIFRKTNTNRPSWVLFFLTLSISGGYALVFHVSPYEIVWQLQTALSRLLLHPGLLALAFAFEALSWKIPKDSTPSSSSTKLQS